MQDLPLMSAGISTKHFQHVFTNLPSVPRPFGETLQTSWVHFVKTIHTVLKKIASDDFPPPFLSFYRLLKYYVIPSKCSNNHSCFDYKQRKLSFVSSAKFRKIRSPCSVGEGKTNKSSEAKQLKKKMHWLMEKNNSHCIFFRAHFCQQPKHKAKVKVQPLLCSFPPSGTLPAQGWWSRAWTLSPWMGMPLQPGCCRCLQVVCFPRKQQLLRLHFRWCTDQLVPIACSQRDGWCPAFWEIALDTSAPS